MLIMKKFYLLFIGLLFGFSSYSQCIFTTQVYPQNGACDTTCNWVISISANGASGPHYLSLNGNYITTFTTFGNIDSLCQGTFVIEITDSAGCNFIDTIVISVVSPLGGTVTSIAPSCGSCYDGSATVTASGGTPPYYFLWSNGATGQTINVGTGIYCVYIYDVMGCMVTVCDSVGAQAGFSIISGYTFIDLDTSGTYLFTEPGAANIQITANPGGYLAWSSNSGIFHLSVPNGTYNISAAIPLNWQQTSIPLGYNLTVNDQFVLNNNFGLLPDTTSIYGSLYFYNGLPRCNQNVNHAIIYRSLGLEPANGEIIFNADPQLSFVSSSVPPTSVTGNSYTWDLQNIYPYTYNYIFTLFTMPAAGNVVSSSIIYNLYDSLLNIAFTDTIYKTDTVKCSWDPNDKQVEPVGIGSQNAVALNSELDFTIRFQNTGNDTAFVVVIKDTLDTHLDLPTFEIIASSHEMYAQMDPGGILTFTFDNILLPDSNVNEPMSHGFVRYRVQPLQPVTDPTVITNTAHIFFDQNPAVVTNTTLTTLSDNLLSVAEIKDSGIIYTYPNPFSNEVLIQFEKNINAELKLYDFSGRVVRETAIRNSSTFVLKKENLNPGVFLLRLTTEKSFATLKLIIN